MRKSAVLYIAFLASMLFPSLLKAQLIPSGNIYAGVAYADSVDVVNRYTFRGWDASAEAFPLRRVSYLGIVVDGSGIYRTGVTQYNIVAGPRISTTFGSWRPFVHAMAGVQEANSGGVKFHPTIEDLGGGVDRKLPFRNFSWRLQFDYIHSHLLSANQNDIRGSTGLVWRF